MVMKINFAKMLGLLRLFSFLDTLFLFLCWFSLGRTSVSQGLLGRFVFMLLGSCIRILFRVENFHARVAGQNGGQLGFVSLLLGF